MERLDYLEEERKKIWKRIKNLEDEIKKKTSDYEAEAKQSSKKTSEFRNKSEVSLSQIETYENSAKQNCNEITKLFEEVKELVVPFKKEIEYINQQHSIVSANEESYSSNIASLESMFENFEDLQEKINDLTELSTEGENTSTKITQLLKTVSEKRNEINRLHLEIIGSEDEDEKGEKIVVPGIKYKLEKSYDDIKDKMSLLQSQLDDVINDSKIDFENKMSEFEEIFQNVNSKIESLLPRALTAGLSYAYSEKREDEVREEKKQTKYFTWAIIGMITVSLIPFGVSIYQLFHKVELYEALMQLPRMVLAILPLYIPVLWYAYSSNKKRNLSKRLIEEYTHKEVLSKTYEGLSTQIANIKDESICADLRNRLLYNVLEVTSCNPGKLISDYNKSDHPFMEALDKSTQLANTIEKLSKIPGLSRLTSLLEKNAKKIVENELRKTEQGLSTIDDDNE